MRKALALLLAAVLPLSGAAAVLGAQLVLRDRETAVTVEEEILYGTPEAAGDLQAVVGTHCGNNLSWLTRFSPGRAEEAEVRFAFFDAFTYTWEEPAASPLTVDFASTGFGGYWGDMEEEDWWANMEQEHFLVRPVRDVADRTGAGEERTETVDLSDYYDVYPLYLSVNSGTMGVYSSSVSAEEQITDFFSFPVPSGTMAEITVRRSETGTLAEINCNQDGYFPAISAVYADNNCAYLYFDREDGSPPLNVSRIAGGYGLYRLNYHPAEETVFYNSDGSPVTSSDALHLDRIETVLPVEGTIRQAVVAPDGEKLLVLWEGDGMLHLAVVELKSGRLVQQLDLLPITEGLGLDTMEFLGDALLLRLRDSTLAVVAPEGEGYRLALSAKPTDILASCFSHGEEGESYRLSSGVAAFDGERLALLYTVDNSAVSPVPDLALLVLGGDGAPVFAARYRHSANDDRGGWPRVMYDDPDWRYEEQTPMYLSYS